jgi:ABC-type sulfate/molybdate transport systems ATPase subunit
MPIDYKLAKVAIEGFRGINFLELTFRVGFPNAIIGANNAGKSTILHAIALALNGGGSHQWTFTDDDFFCNQKGERTSQFLIRVLFHTDTEDGYPAVRGVGKAVLIHGVQVKGNIRKDGSIHISRTLLDAEGKPVTISTRSPLAKAEKERWAEHSIEYRPVNARLDDIYVHTPEVWLFKPQNIEASLYVWKTGPITKLSKLLASRFLYDEWEMERADGVRKMPATLHRAHRFFRDAVEAFPFWKDVMKPRLEAVFSRYVGTHAKIDLRPDTQAVEDWLAQTLAVSLASDPNSISMPLKRMGDGWQSVIRLAALEALTEYPDLVRERVVLLLEEPETHLHPHLRRKVRTVLGRLAAKGWTVVYTTHSSEMVSFEEDLIITRVVRTNGSIIAKSVGTDAINSEAKLQSKMDEHGTHDFLFGTAAVFCEGKDDQFALRLGLENKQVDCDARSVSVSQCGSITAIPAFVEISKVLGIRWCAVTDQDLQPDGTINPATERARNSIERHRGAHDKQIQWPVDLEDCLGLVSGKAVPEICQAKLSDPEWASNHPQFSSALSDVAQWIDPTLRA